MVQLDQVEIGPEIFMVIIYFFQILSVARKKKVSLFFKNFRFSTIYTEIYYIYNLRDIVDHIHRNLFYIHYQFVTIPRHRYCGLTD